MVYQVMILLSDDEWFAALTYPERDKALYVALRVEYVSGRPAYVHATTRKE